MAKHKRLNFDNCAPDLALTSTTGEMVQLSSLWAERPLLLVLTRHFGCTQCKEMLEELVAGRERIHAAGLNLAVILQGDLESSAGFAAAYAPGLLCLADPARKAYQAFGLERGSLFQTFLNPKVWSAVSSSVKKGYKVEPPPAGQDAMQMSGIFIISRQGRVELPYYFDHIADLPPLDLLLAGVFATKWDQPFDGPVGRSAGADATPQQEE
jgi:peroxiredoxin